MEKEKVKKKTEGFFTEFKKFAFRDSTLGIAIGIMLGTAIKSVIDSLVNDLLTPPIAKITSGIDFSNLYFALGSEKYDSLQSARDAGAVVITYGNFINAIISFLITAFVLFMIVNQGTKLIKKEKREVAKVTKVCPYCKSNIAIDAKKCAYCTSVLK